MIRINLVAEGRKAVAQKTRTGPKFSFESKNIAAWALVAGVLLIALSYAAYWFVLDRDITGGNEEIAKTQAIVDELQEIIDEVERFTERKEELAHKIEVISGLRDNQRGPVRIMDQVSRGLPELLWLDELNLSARAVTISGRSFTTNAVASFIENLDRVDEFQEPVLKSTTWNGDVYAFQIVFNYRVVPIRSARPAEVGTPAR